MLLKHYKNKENSEIKAKFLWFKSLYRKLKADKPTSKTAQ